MFEARISRTFPDGTEDVVTRQFDNMRDTEIFLEGIRAAWEASDVGYTISKIAPSRAREG